MKYDLFESPNKLHRLAMEDRAKREQEEKERMKNMDSSSVPRIDSQEYIDNCDIPGAMDDGVALFLYILVMVVGIIFKDRALVWSGATIVYLCHVFRRQLWKRRNKK